MSSKRLIVDDADPAMVYSGSWTTGTTLSVITNEYNSTYHRSGTIGDSVLFTFQGEVYFRSACRTVRHLFDHPSTTFMMNRPDIWHTWSRMC
jgi:hypothetical protein